MPSATDGTEALPLSGTPDDGRLSFPPRAEIEARSEEMREVLRAVRSFYRADPGAVDTLATPGDDLLPALLFAFRDPARVRIDYPLYLPGSKVEGDDTACLPLADLLRRQLEVIAPAPDDAKILKDNVARLERSIRFALADASEPTDAAPQLEAAGQAMIEELGLRPASTETLRDDLARLVESLAPGGRFLTLDEEAGLHLFVAAGRDAGHARQAALRDEVHRAGTTLRDLLRIERSKQITESTPDTLRDSIGSTGAARLDTDALARVLGSRRAPSAMDGGLRDVIEQNLAVIDAFLAAGSSPLMTLVGTEADIPTMEEDVGRRLVERDEVCRAAAATFDTQAASYAELFAALRTARLLASGSYERARHERLRAAFDWSAFTRQELLALPPVVAIESASHLAGSGMIDCSRLLLSGRPVEILVRVKPATNPGTVDDPLTGYRFELAYLGISHREVLVHQSSAARPDHLMAGFRRSLDAATGSIHVVTDGLGLDGEAARLGSWMHAGAALDGRAHPFIHYDPEAGATWARRLDLGGNPQPEADWPVYELACDGADGATSIPLAFTFADFVLLEPRFRTHFRVIPPIVPEDELMPLADYVAQRGDDEPERIPFIWAAGEDGQAQRLAVDRILARACQDRLHYWRTLQELAGIRNEHVREAVERERERLEGEFATERARLAEAHADEIAQVRQDEARAVLHRLAQSLLGTDVESLAASVLTSPPADVTPDAAATEAAATEAPTTPDSEAAASGPAATPDQVEEDDGDEEPWIDSALCTSCNDCMDINPQVFVYNANKQAVIGDARAGTYAQLVQAAEKCPARCIHPGRPLNSDEPGLDALVERARPFNT